MDGAVGLLGGSTTTAAAGMGVVLAKGETASGAGVFVGEEGARIL